MKNLITLFVVIVFSVTGFAQTTSTDPDSLKEYQGQVVSVYTKEYLSLYNRMKKMVVKVYPYALHAADIIDEINMNSASIERRRKLNAYYKDSYKTLKENFKYFILDLYTSEGEMLMKLIHRETGMTVYDISSKYRGKKNAEMFNMMAKIWDQNLHVKFDPTTGNDKVAEQVIQDIQAGLIPFNDEIVTVTKLEYRDEQRKIRARDKMYKENKKEYDRKMRKKKRELNQNN
jgi:hypothetical protein